ncbi:hypothetical protein MVG78_02040 [Roseomonas gilardii subsp. gilardii]|uniref:hypothetical protein n=1 Tax=Roseomonas gilardii TaxID=257708 RepID=UPI001FF8E436|nr:hypothetical protein [Roseomonas gilardii]UPG72991.1 hypothetical protein MVG78_02040 [Roseomonas gilardii subsp. gilardii]
MYHGQMRGAGAPALGPGMIGPGIVAEQGKVFKAMERRMAAEPDEECVTRHVTSEGQENRMVT